MSEERKLIPYRRRCVYAKDDGYCDYWKTVTKCMGCKFANHPTKALKDFEDTIIFHRRQNKVKNPGLVEVEL